jgi:hypothetical protein
MYFSRYPCPCACRPCLRWNRRYFLLPSLKDTRLARDRSHLFTIETRGAFWQRIGGPQAPWGDNLLADQVVCSLGRHTAPVLS